MLGTRKKVEQEMKTTQLEPPSERELIEQATLSIGSSLPDGWECVINPSAPAEEQNRVDAILRITAPGGTSGDLKVEVKSILSPKDVTYILNQMILWGDSDRKTLFVARYLSPSTRRAIGEKSASYIDATGNADISLDEPALLIKTQGLDRDPFRGPERRTSSLKGRPAARVVRALVDYKPPWKMRDLEQVADTSLASISRTVDFLDREDLVTRNERGSIEDVDWEGLLKRWADDYRIDEKRARVGRYLAPRGILNTLEALDQAGMNYTLSGSFAAQNWAPYAEPKSGLVYVTDLDMFREKVRVIQDSATADLVVVEPPDSLPFERSETLGGRSYVAPSQACVDLMVGPGRNPEEALELIRWMRSNEDKWRQDGL